MRGNKQTWNNRDTDIKKRIENSFSLCRKYHFIVILGVNHNRNSIEAFCV